MRPASTLPSSARAAARPTRVALVALVAAVGLAGCSSQGSSTASSAVAPAIGDVQQVEGAAPAEAQVQGSSRAAMDSAGSTFAGPAAPAASGDKAAAGSAGSASTARAVAASTQRLVRTATLLLRVPDVLTAAADVRAIATGAGGTVTAEDLVTSGDPLPLPTATATPAGASSGLEKPTDHAAAAPRVAAADTTVGGSTSTAGTMTVSVPVARLEATLDQLAKLGTVSQRSTTTSDVTSTYVDTSSRIATMTASIDRVRALMTKASAIDQVVALEGELSRREADLESLKAQLASLDQQTTMASISLSLATPGTTTEPGDDGSGFLSGLRSGWSGFVSIVTGLATGLGAALPFLGAAAVLGLPVAGWLRRRRSQRAGRNAPTLASTGPTPQPEPQLVGAPAPEAGSEAEQPTERGRGV